MQYEEDDLNDYYQQANWSNLNIPANYWEEIDKFVLRNSDKWGETYDFIDKISIKEG